MVFRSAGKIYSISPGPEPLQDPQPAWMRLSRHDAGMVARLTQAGMVTIGKTNLSEFAFSGLGINPTFTTPALLATDGEEHVPGGSSSGAARAVAQGVACIAIGTDTAGSCASCCV
jgi:aspartyl-tRNA(Asn)/glutamyl-tRNA(Gln) amidotransferase subunit A